ncbi:MAG: triose-phosphate isomerase [Gammaproteobacteria bacterium]|nr:triose-phosphate isomerase [Gammaproteobacteria bacterium]
MRKPLIAGNWKMNGTKDGITDLVTILVAGEVNNVDMLVIPPFVYLEQVGRELGESGIRLGAQNVDWRAQGALTGEIEASMLKEVGCELCLTGHSERRQLFAETDDQVACKFKACLEHDVTPILCVGETLQQRQAGQTMEVVLRQVRSVMEAVGPAGIGQGIVAYEPVWAIGTGESASPEQAEEVHGNIRQAIARDGPATAEKLRILYGGSVNSENAAELFRMEDIDGALVGGASLIGKEFLTICELAARGMEN